MRDLVTGVLTVIPGVSSGASESDATFYIAGQQPSFLSPDGEQVLVRGGRTQGRDADALVLSGDAGVRELFVRGPVFPAGWSPDGRIAWLTKPDGPPPPPLAHPSSWPPLTPGKEIGRLPLELSRPMQFSQWSPSLSPDGDFLNLISHRGADGGVLVRVSLRTGKEVARVSLPEEWADSCAPAFRDDDVLIPVRSGEGSARADGVVLANTVGDAGRPRRPTNPRRLLGVGVGGDRR